MSRLLSRPSVASDPRTLNGPSPSLDAYATRVVEQAAQDAYQRGLADGRRAVEQELAAAGDRANGPLRAAIDRVVAEIVALRDERRDGDIELAVAIATAVIGAEPAAGGAALVARIQSTLEHLDDEQLQITVHPDDELIVRSSLGTVEGVEITVVPDPRLNPGEARISGTYARADLTRDAALRAIGELLAESADA